jgi:hypothetical protein
MKNNLNEQVSRIKDMMKRVTTESYDDLSDKVELYSKFKSPNELLMSIRDRLSTAVQMQEWSMVEEVAMDVYNFIKNNMKQDDDDDYEDDDEDSEIEEPGDDEIYNSGNYEGGIRYTRDSDNWQGR